MTFFFVLIVWHFSTVILKPIRGVCTQKHIRFLSKLLSSVCPGTWFEPRLSSFFVCFCRWVFSMTCCSLCSFFPGLEGFWLSGRAPNSVRPGPWFVPGLCAAFLWRDNFASPPLDKVVALLRVLAFPSTQSRLAPLAGDMAVFFAAVFPAP